MIVSKKNKALFLFLFINFLFGQLSFGQFNIPKKPDFQTSVYDYANLLEASEKAQLEQKLIRYSDSTSTQVVVITIESLKGEDIGILTPKWGQEWGIGGSKENDNGVLILLAKAEKKIWLAPGYGVESKLTAGINGQLIRSVMVPEFKKGSYYLGLDKGADAIFEVLKGTYKGERKTDNKDNRSALIFLVVFIAILILISRNKNKNGGSGMQNGGPSFLDMIILSNLGRSGGGFGGGSSGDGGGFGGGFGGGGFSGGGAGGDW